MQALTAGLARINGDARSRLQMTDAIADRSDDTGDLVTERHRLLNAHGAEAAMVIIVQVGAADAAIGDLDADLAGAGHGVGIIVDPQVLRRVDDDGAHGLLPLRNHIAASMPPST